MPAAEMSAQGAAARANLRHAQFAEYPADAAALDLYRLAPPHVATKWRAMAAGLSALRDDAGIPVAEIVARQIQELGLSFRMTGDTEERAWPLSPMPLVIGAAQWAEIERGLIQRAELIEAVTDDIYGPQNLVRQGHLPAALVTGSRYFARNLMHARQARAAVAGSGGAAPWLSVYAADLVCGPGGVWQVVGDRLRLANGIGYALENRLALSRSTGGLLGEIHTRRLARFFADLRGGMAHACSRENPRIALLTPGRFNQSYPEQAHLARYLGFPLVEGRDLTVSDDRLYVRTIAGPKRIDALWRWIDTNALDPLAFDSRGEIGVADGFEAWLRCGVEWINAPGAEVMEAPAFAAFLPRLCEAVRGEPAILPDIASWWCGEPGQADIVRDRFDDLVITSAFGRSVEGLPTDHGMSARSVSPGALSQAERNNLVAAMVRRPLDYCGQAMIRQATTPTLVDEHLVPRAFVLRTFVARGADGAWTVMPGGFARLSPTADIPTVWLGEGDMSADVCIVDDVLAPGHVRTGIAPSPTVRRGGGILASQAADNLFWFARYLERAEIILRVIRAVLGSMIEVDTVAGSNPETIAALLELLVERGAIKPATGKLPAAQAAYAALTETSLPGGVGTLFARFAATGLTLRDRITPDFWRLVNRPLPLLESQRPGIQLRAARELIERLSALSGMLAENFNRGPSWRFIDLGRRLERALGVCDTVATLAGDDETPEALGVLLDLSDSQITYRARYLSGPRRDPVCDLLLLDPDNPRSLVFQVDAICAHIAALPTLREDMMPEAPLLQARALQGPLHAVTIEQFDAALLHDTEERLLALSDTIAARYFLQYERSATVADGGLLA